MIMDANGYIMLTDLGISKQLVDIINIPCTVSSLPTAFSYKPFSPQYLLRTNATTIISISTNLLVILFAGNLRNCRLHGP
jgi:hypothetical protein